jgi:hypothetical protein
VHVYIYPPGVVESLGFIKSPDESTGTGRRACAAVDRRHRKRVSGIPITRRLHWQIDPRANGGGVAFGPRPGPGPSLRARSLRSALTRSDRGDEVGAAAAAAAGPATPSALAWLHPAALEEERPVQSGGPGRPGPRGVPHWHGSLAASTPSLNGEAACHFTSALPTCLWNAQYGRGPSNSARGT